MDGRVEPVSVEGLKGVEALVGAVGSPRPPPTGGPRQLGDDGGHGDFQWRERYKDRFSVFSHTVNPNG